jgi:hypothetical protein
MSRKAVSAIKGHGTSRRIRTGGYLLIELALALAISTILLASQFAKIVSTIDENNALGTGKYLVKLQAGINEYVQNNEVALKSGDTVTGFAAPLSPEISELIAKKYLDAGFSLQSPLGLVFKNKLDRSGSCPGGADCKIGGQAFSTTGLVDGEGRLRVDILTTAVAEIGPDAGMSYAEAPSVLRSMGGGTVSNPAGSVAGTLAIRIGGGSGLLPLLGQYYKLDGSRPLSGKMSANGNDIDGVRNLQVTDSTSTKDLIILGDTKIAMTGTPGASCVSDTALRRNESGAGLVICYGNTWQTVGNVVPGIADGAPCSLPGQLGTNATGASFLCNGSYWSTTNTFANLGDLCAPAGKTAASISTREQLFCSNGKFVRLANLVPKQVEVSRVLVSDYMWIQKPICEVGGTPSYTFNLTQTVVDVSVTPPRQAMYISTTEISGKFWQVNIKVKDNTNAEFSATDYGITAVMKLECAY